MVKSINDLHFYFVKCIGEADGNKNKESIVG